MPHLPREEIYLQLFEKYGSAQLVVAMEELAELQQQILKLYRVMFEKKKVSKRLYNHLIEELADVTIMIEQVIFILSILKDQSLDDTINDFRMEHTKKLVDIETKLELEAMPNEKQTLA